MLLLFIPTQLKATTEKVNEVSLVASAEATVENSYMSRLEEIKAMDISSMSRAEKNELRSEVRAIKTDMDEQNNKDAKTATNEGGIYISVGGAILILILLIILL